MPRHISTKMTTKTGRFADSPNDTYMYDSAHIPSQTATYSSQRLFQQPSISQQQQTYMYYHSRSLDDTPSPDYDHYPLSSWQTLSSSPTSHTSQSGPSFLPPCWPVSIQPPPTPDGLRNPITLPPVAEDPPEASIAFELYEYLHTPHLDTDGHVEFCVCFCVHAFAFSRMRLSRLHERDMDAFVGRLVHLGLQTPVTWFH